METTTDRPVELDAIRTDLGAIFVSREHSRSSWIVTALLPGGAGKMSRHVVPGGDIAGLLARFSQLRDKAAARTGRTFPIIVIREAGLDGFWIHRALVDRGVESHVVDPASIATSRSQRRRRPTGSTARRWSGPFPRRAEGLRHGAGAEPRGRRLPTHHARAQGADRGAHPSRQPHQGPAVRAGHPRL